MSRIRKSLVLTFVTIVIASNGNAGTPEQKCRANKTIYRVVP